jgi:ACR3 family arsenite efflux pump ArsB
MPCLLVILVLIFPRVALLFIFFTSNYLERAYHGLLLPFLGFFFVPLTTLAYAWMVNNHQPIQGINLLLLVIAIVIDFGGLGGGEYHRRRRL